MSHYPIAAQLCLLSLLVSCSVPPKIMDAKGPLTVSPEQLNFDRFEGDEATLSLSVTNNQDEALTLTSWSLTEYDQTSELFLDSAAPWDQEEVQIGAGQTVSMKVIWRPLDEEQDRGQVTLDWSTGTVTVEVNTVDLTTDLIVGGEEGGVMMAGVMMAGEVAAGVMTAGEMTAGEMTAGETAGVMTAGEVAAGVMTAGEMTAGEMTAGEMMGGTEVSDFDGDGVSDERDNCVSQANPEQLDRDRDGQGDECDSEPNVFGGVVTEQSIGLGSGESSNEQYSISSELVLSTGSSSSAQYHLSSVVSP